MTWFRVDDTFYRSKKVRKLGSDRVPAVGLWTLCGDWSADNLTDGFVPWEVVEDWDSGRLWADRLIGVGLWTEIELDGEKGVQFHDWTDWQPTKEQVEQRRKADAIRRAKWREDKKRRDAALIGKQAKQTSNGVPASQCDIPRDSQCDATVTDIRDTSRDDADQYLFDESPDVSRRDTTRESRPGSVLPDPTRPDPTSSKEEVTTTTPRKREPLTPLPDTWRPNANHVRQASELGLDLDFEVNQFRAQAEATDRRQARWDAAFRQWLDKAHQFNKRHRGGLRAVSGGYVPFHDHDESAYDEGI